MNALKKIRSVSEILSRHGIDSAEKEAHLIVTHCLAVDVAGIYRDDPEISDEVSMEIDGIIIRRTGHEPLQYILGRIDFMGLTISLGRDVLIPRPETEMMAEYAVEVMRDQGAGGGGQGTDSGSRTADNEPRLTILDLCTGSGCIALALAKSFPGAKVYGVDISETAVGYSRKNALANDIHNVWFISGNMFDAIKGDQRFDLIIANPPYIPSAEIRDLQPEISQWEPRSALDGGADGLDAYRAIIPLAGNFLKNNGILILELGIGLAEPVSILAEKACFSGVTRIKDLAGIERIIKAEWTK